MSDTERVGQTDEADIDTVLEHLEDLSETVDDEEERVKVHRTMSLVESLPFAGKIEKYTTRDMAQAFVGGILISMPFLVEDGVFVIAEHFLEETFLGVPVLLFANIGFLVLMTTGLLYWSDIRDVRIHKPIFGLIPRRLLGVLIISFMTSALMMALWGRLDAPPVDSFARICVVWTASAFGAALGDILPGHTGGEDVNDLVRDFLKGE